MTAILFVYFGQIIELDLMNDNNDFSMVLWTRIISALPIHLGNWSH